MPGTLLAHRPADGRPRGRLLSVLLAVAALVVLTACGASTGAASTGAASAAGAGVSVSDAADLAPMSPTTSLGSMVVDQLPPEGVDTLRLIASDGPFPYSKDGSTFQNREGILPSQRKGFYREYTVETPGSDDRGARRIIGGDDGSRFYTDDHYSSFREIVSGEGS